MAERHKPTTAALQSTTDACAGRFDIGVARGARPHALSRTLTTAVACTTRQFKAASLPHHAQHAAVPNAATQGGLHCARLRAHIVRRTHARTHAATFPLHPHPDPFARALDAHVTRPSPPTSFSEPPRRHICAGGPARWALQFWNPVRVWQAEEAVANLPLRLAVRGHCQRACAQPDGVHARGTQAGLK